MVWQQFDPSQYTQTFIHNDLVLAQSSMTFEQFCLSNGATHWDQFSQLILNWPWWDWNDQNTNILTTWPCINMSIWYEAYWQTNSRGWVVMNIRCARIYWTVKSQHFLILSSKAYFYFWWQYKVFRYSAFHFLCNDNYRYYFSHDSCCILVSITPWPIHSAAFFRSIVRIAKGNGYSFSKKGGHEK